MKNPALYPLILIILFSVLSVSSLAKDNAPSNHANIPSTQESNAVNIAPEFHYKYQYSSLDYKETNIMELSGYMFGLEMYLKAKGNEKTDRLSGILQTSLGTGSLNYSGSTWAGTPLKFSGVPATMFETKLLAEYDYIITDKDTITPYIGLGYRLFADNMGYASSSGYRRQSNYRYVPIGLEYITAPHDNYRLKIILESDSFISGRQVSYLEDVDPTVSTVVNEQRSGNGYKLSLSGIYDSLERNGLIELFYRYWDIANSDIEELDGSLTGTQGLEPKNNSSEIGISVCYSL